MQRLFVPLLLVLAVLLPLLAQASGMEYYIGVVTRILIFAMVAASLNFILGYGGMVSFGHAVFFGLGAYVTAIASFHGVTSAWLIWLLAALVTALVGLVIGVIALRTRAVYFIMITMALAQLFYYFFVGFRYYGGDDGLQVTARPLLGFGLDMSGDNAFYWVVLAWLVASFVLLQRLLASRFGLALNAIRQNERRAQAIGYPALRYKLAAFVIAAVIAGLAGSLIGMSNLFASPKLLHWSQSGILLVMVALGGVGYFYGGLLGAAAFLLLEEVLSTHFEYWQIYVGLILLLVVMVAPRGVSSLATIGKTLKQESSMGREQAAVALSVKGLKKNYGGLAATRDVDLEIAAGHVHAIIGPNGAGKTTLLSLLSGALAADAGEVYLFGQPMHGHAEQARVAAGLVRSFQITSVFDELSVLENLQVAVQRQQHRSYGFFHASASDRDARDAAMTVARRVGLEKLVHQRSSQLSHGARRRLDVGLAIACGPRVLLMDEPMAGMGHEESGDMIALIQSLKEELTVVLVEHDMEAVFALADRMTVLVQGAVLATGSVEEIRANAEVKLAYLGEEETQ